MPDQSVTPLCAPEMKRNYLVFFSIVSLFFSSIFSIDLSVVFLVVFLVLPLAFAFALVSSLFSAVFSIAFSFFFSAAGGLAALPRLAGPGLVEAPLVEIRIAKLG